MPQISHVRSIRKFKILVSSLWSLMTVCHMVEATVKMEIKKIPLVMKILLGFLSTTKSCRMVNRCEWSYTRVTMRLSERFVK
ncbi:Uncharacterized protein APZ42_030462 [Daphnia magna]|uniref:Uncharacterized protein n=1 Tax=Daphnia magna TaxID=35525 RepID=A0A164NR19_9CRUS|nr:Uncharacterized protein APZ42_030462 [Daphnia magna]